MRKVIILMVMVITMFSLISCGKEEGFDPENPTTIIIWTYYNGEAKEVFDTMIQEFNDTVGKEVGIVVNTHSTGNVARLAEEVLASANEDIDAQPMPNIFAAYPDNAYAIDGLDIIVDLDKYFTKEELDSYHPDFIEGGRFGEENKLKILPIAKSSEIIFINYTDFSEFQKEEIVFKHYFETWEGIAKVSENYYHWTDEQTPELNDGKALFGFDTLANYMIIGVKQLGEEIYQVDNGVATITLSPEAARKLWDNFYLPFIKGYYADSGVYRADDMKTGELLGYIGSTAGTSYFPTQIELGKDDSYPIEGITLPFPVFEGGKPVTVHQGAGMVLAKSDELQQEASVLFLKWFTDATNNSKFAVQTGYYPVKTEVLNINNFNKTYEEIFDSNSNDSNNITQNAAKSAYEMIDNYEMYVEKPFENSYELRKLLDSSLLDISKEDRMTIQNKLATGEDRNDVIGEFSTDENFEKWYNSLITEMESMLLE